MTVCRGPGAQDIYSTHGTPSFMPGFYAPTLASIRESWLYPVRNYACFYEVKVWGIISLNFGNVPKSELTAFEHHKLMYAGSQLSDRCPLGYLLSKSLDNSHQLDQSISILRVVRQYFTFLLILIKHSVRKQWRPRSDAAFCSVWSGPALFVFVPQNGL